MSPSTLISPAAGSMAAIVGTPPTAQRSAGDGSPTPDSFAMALSQATSPPPPPAPPPAAAARDETRSDPVPADTATGDSRTAPAPDSATAARAAAHRKTVATPSNAVDEKPPSAGHTTGPVPAETDAGRLATQAQDTPGADRAGESGDAAPDAANLLAALIVGTPASMARAAGKATLQDAGGVGVTTASGPSRPGAGPAGDTPAAAPAAAPASAARRGESGTDAPAVAAERDTASRPSTAAAAPAASSAPNAAAPPLSASTPVLSAATAGANPPTVAEARLHASPGSAEFAPALGAQLNVFLREGVQHARLHLHPAELGPLTVQIQLDGVTAQVRLAAEHPLTRQALEQAMPALAGSLRESGLTLTGGGVFEQPANPQPQQDGRAADGERTAGGRRGRDSSVQADAAPPRTVLARRGVVDLVA